jgi:recombinational DNA repair protein (RecF pathway)
MAHQVFHSETYVLSSHPFGEANKILHLLTKEFGMITATAQGLRADRSKLRYSLQDCGRARVSIVRGKHSWKVTGAESEEQYWVLWREDREKLALFRRIGILLIRLLPGEEQHEEVYTTLQLLVSALKDATTKEKLESIETISVARIVHALGYVEETALNTALLAPTEPFPASITPSVKNLLITTINTALAHSQL